ncbi:MAG TPA: CDP-alcohol phosphatidyltransferase family protein [Candidatus Omnitrophota bacterium]|nr:CDP-alcohol phosphatidyltransferase family protein [Candidatus Omnitrophota bacterium]HPW76511.1 CDP-alcohol phosphatidyltransferase family protein [Candidatus Omnitrophota bacterium]HQB11758.1 CDP-alcohol phosphatidyltransferase family protein [Candidatus Omnitrophota bacterium]
MSIPNYLTLLRIILTPVFITSLISYSPEKEYLRYWALAIFALAGLTDALDGILARVLRQKTALGEILDPLADKLLLLSGYISLLFVDSVLYHPPLWITIVIIFRDVVLSIGFFTLHFLRVPFDAKPNLIGKATTVFQMSLLLLILLKWPVAVPVAYVTGFLTILSGVIYVSKALKRIPS